MLLYIMEWSPLVTGDELLGQSVGSINDITFPRRVFEIKEWCRKFPGVRKKVHVAMARSISKNAVL